LDTFTSLITEICAEEGIGCKILSYGWLIELSRSGQTRHIIGRHFDVNPAAADRIACDKYACYTVLNSAGIPAFEHALFFNPLRRAHLIRGGEFERAESFLRQHKKIVVKPNAGWQGRDVFLCGTSKELENALCVIFQSEPDACLCPFYEYEYEYRVFYVDGICRFAYGKARPPHEWRHNLSNGASAFEITDEALRGRVEALAARAARQIGIAFATVDIARLNGDNDSLSVVEINSGITANKFLEQKPGYWRQIKKIYSEAIGRMFL
jgi:glutathione synthase/RimK-type ligase-like ATP-grasp enzyme